MWSRLKRRFMYENGATMVEYGIIVGFIAAVMVMVVAAIGLKVLGLFNLTW